LVSRRLTKCETRAAAAHPVPYARVCDRAFENGTSEPKAETLQTLQRTYEDAGVIFSRRDGEGVTLRSKP